MTIQLSSPHKHGKFPREGAVKVTFQTYGEGFAINLHALSRLSDVGQLKIMACRSLDQVECRDMVGERERSPLQLWIKL